MARCDVKGREYAKLSELTHLDMVELDGGFTCIEEKLVVVCEDDKGLHFLCSEGKHYLDGQDDGDGYCVGVYPHKPMPKDVEEAFNRFFGL